MNYQSILKTPVLLSYFISLVALGSLSACEDHREEIEPTRFRLKKTVRTTAYRANTKDTTTIVYTYDAQGRLSNEAQVETNTYGPVRYVKNATFTYDPQNRLTKIDADYSGNYSAFERFEYTYDSAGSIILEMKLTNVGKSPTTNYQVTGKTEFTYDGARQPATAVNEYGKSSFTYTNGNLYQVVFTSSDPKQPVNTTTYQYDDKPNPYYGVIRSGGIQAQLFSVNNQREDLVTEPKRILTYNALGLLVRFNSTHKPNPPYNYDEQTTYEYESY